MRDIGEWLHSGSVHENSQPVLVAVVSHPAHRFTSADPLSEAGSAAQPAEERRQRVQLELSRLLGKALLLLRPDLPGQGGPPHTLLRQRRSHPGKRSQSDGYFSFEVVAATLQAASFYTGEQHRQHKV